MLKLLDIHFKFFCRSTHQNGEGKNPIILRIVYNGQRRDLFTGLYCIKSAWNKKIGQVSRFDKSAEAINQNLLLILQKVNHHFDAMRFSGSNFSIDDLVEKVKGKGDRPELLMDFLEQEIEKIKKRVNVDLTKSSFYKYHRTLKYLQEFLQKEYKMKNYALTRIDLKFLESYFQFLRIEKKLSHNVAHKFVMMTKSNLFPAIKSGIIKGDPFRELKIRVKPVYPDFLTQEDLNKIISTELNDPDLDRKRDIFLFACYTGLAYIDLKNLSADNIIQDTDGSWYIKKNRQKTGEQSIIPLLPAAVKVLRKYSLSDDLRKFCWFISSNQKMNKGLKSIGRRCEISKPLHMHLARHTFATTVTLSNGVPIESVSKMLGHSNIKITQHYAQVVAAKVKGDMAKIKDLYQ